MICGSIYHWARECPNSYIAQSTKLKQNSSDINHPTLQDEKVAEDSITIYSDTMRCFVGETFSTAVLDSGCTTNVCGKMWLQCYKEFLNPSDQSLITIRDSNTLNLVQVTVSFLNRL